MRFKNSLVRILSIGLLSAAANIAFAANIGSVHGSQCHSKTENANIHNSVWGIENQSTSSTGRVACAIQLTGNLDNSFTRGGLAPIKVRVTTQDWNKANKCVARLRHSNAKSKDDFGANWVTNTTTGSYTEFDIIDEWVDYTSVKGKYIVVECELHKRVSGKNPPTIRAINVFNNQND